MANDGLPTTPPTDGAIFNSNSNNSPSPELTTSQQILNRQRAFTAAIAGHTAFRHEVTIPAAGESITSVRTNLLPHRSNFSTLATRNAVLNTSGLPSFPVLSSLMVPDTQTSNYRAIPVVRLTPRVPPRRASSPIGVDSFDIKGSSSESRRFVEISDSWVQRILRKRDQLYSM